MVKVTNRWDEIVRFASMWNMEGLVIIGFCEDYKKLRDSMRIPFVVYDGDFEETERIGKTMDGRHLNQSMSSNSSPSIEQINSTGTAVPSVSCICLRTVSICFRFPCTVT